MAIDGADPQAVVPQQSLPSPYALHPSDNPGALITSVLLHGDNYSEWATELSNSLQAKQKLGFINGTVPKPTAEPDQAKWLATNSMIIGWIRTSIDPKIRSTVTFVPEAHTLWESLAKRFSVQNGVRIHTLRDEIANCRQDGQSVLDYFGRLTKLWEELDTIKTSRSCTCEASTDIAKEREDVRVHKFLFGLHESRFRNIRSQIIDEDPLPDMNNVYSRVIREEQHNHKARSQEIKTETAIGFTVQSKLAKEETARAAAAAFRSRDPNRSCTHCSRKGHDNSECFLLHGYPDWWYELQQQRGTPSQRGRGGRTGTRGRGRGNMSRVNNTTAPWTVGWTPDQLAQLMQLLQTPRSAITSEKLTGPFYEDPDWNG